MWAQAVKKAGSTDTDKVIAAMAGQTFTAPSGITSMMDPKNHHLHKSVFIGEIKADGQFNVVWKTPGPVKAQPWSPFIFEVMPLGAVKVWPAIAAITLSVSVLPAFLTACAHMLKPM